MAQPGNNVEDIVVPVMNRVKYSATLEPFDINCPGDWSYWIRRFNTAMIAAGMDEADEKFLRANLLTALGRSSYNLLASLTAPKMAEDYKYKEIIELLTNHFTPPPSCILARYQLHKRVQKEDESVADYSAALRELSVHCSFGQCLEHALRDQFIAGMKDSATQEKLFRRKVEDVTFNNAVLEAITAEKARSECRALREDNSNTIAALSSTKKSNKAPTCLSKCFGCGDMHYRKDCPFKTSKCRKCDKKGHIAKVCKSGNLNKTKSNSKNSLNFKKKRTNENAQQGTHAIVESATYSNTINAIENFQGHYSAVQPKLTSDASYATVQLGVNQAPVSFQIDCGSPETLMNFETFHNLELNEDDLLAYSKPLFCYLGGQVDIKGHMLIQVKFRSVDTKLDIVVVNGPRPNIIGRSWFPALGIKIEIISNLTSKSPNFISEFKEVFSPGLGKFKGSKISFNLSSEIMPIAFPPRRVPLGIKPAVEDEIKSLIQKGVLIPIEKSNWATPVVPVVKPDGSIRLCADYRVTLNKVLKPKIHPIPMVTHVFAEIGGSKFFAKLDLSQAYLQLEVDEESAIAQTITTHLGLFKVTRLQFGLNIAPSVFQEFIDNLLKGIPGIIKYLDDILIFANTVQRLNTTIRTVLERFQFSGIRLKYGKCIFLAESIEFLGYTINAQGIKPSRKLTEAIINAPEPQDKASLQSFLGLINFYHSFMPNKAHALEPLNRLLRKNIHWVWRKEQQVSFDSVKQLIISNSLLVHFDPHKKIVLTVDASPIGVGVVLAHRMDDGKELPIAFHSKTLTTAERNYSQLDREALAIVVGVKKFHYFLYGHSFEIVTDHKPLLGIFDPKKQIPDIINPRRLRWIIFLSGYNYSLVHMPGKSISHADALSRSPVTLTKEKETDSICFLDMWKDTPLNPTIIAKLQDEDLLLKQVREYVRNGWPYNVSSELKPYLLRRNDITLLDNCLVWGSRIILPKIQQNNILNQLHVAHPGVVRMKALARSYVWWPNIDDQIEAFIHNCVSCQVHQNAPPSTKVHPWPSPSGAWERIHIDFAGPFRNKLLLIVVDSFSKWIEVRQVSATSTKETLFVLHELFASWGVPKVIVSDNGTAFTSADFATFIQSNAIQFVRIPPFHPSSNGRAERAVQTTKASLKRIFHNVSALTSTEWNLALSRFLLSQHVTPIQGLNKSPAELLQGRQLRTCLSIILPNNSLTSNSTVSYANSVDIGMLVWARNYSAYGCKWIPGKIIGKKGNVLFDVLIDDNRKLVRHLDQLRMRRVLDDMPSEENVESAYKHVPCSNAPLNSTLNPITITIEEEDTNGETSRSNVNENIEGNISSNAPVPSTSTKQKTGTPVVDSIGFRVATRHRGKE